MEKIKKVAFPRESIYATLEDLQSQAQQNLQEWENQLENASEPQIKKLAFEMKAKREGEITAYEVAKRLLIPFEFDL